MLKTDIYLEICEKIIDSFSMRCNQSKETINLQTKTESIAKGNLGVFGHILYDLHEEYNVPQTYNEFEQFKIFPTIEDIVTFFYNKLN